MKVIVTRVFAVFMGCVFSVVATPFNAAWVSGDANWIVHVDLAAMRESSVGQALLADDLDTAMPLHQAKEKLGMDPRTDLNAITLYGRGAGQDDFVALLQGALNPEKLVEQIQGMTGYTLSRHGSRDIHSWIDEQDGESTRVYGAIVDRGRGVASKNLEHLQTALAVLDGSQNNVAQGRLDTAILSGQGLLLAATADLRSVDLSANPMLAGANAGIFRMQVREAGGNLAMRIAVQQESVQEAQQAEGMLNGFKMMGMMQLGQENPDLAGLLQAITISRNDDMLLLSMSYPVGKIVDLIKSAAQPGAQE